MLSIKEVTPIPGVIHTLNIPPDTIFSKRVHQKPLTPPQWVYVHNKIDELIKAGAIKPCSPSEVKCIAPITLAHKAHKGTGLTMEELQRCVNEECKAANLPNPFNVPKRSDSKQRIVEPLPATRKWRICHNFGKINKVTEIAPMLQGDIWQKQQNLSGHRWVCTFDFASGFYTVVLAEKLRAYVCFYVEGRGYLQCIKMPFSLTGAPAMFAYQMALHLHDLLIDDTIELLRDVHIPKGVQKGLYRQAMQNYKLGK